MRLVSVSTVLIGSSVLVFGCSGTNADGLGTPGAGGSTQSAGGNESGKSSATGGNSATTATASGGATSSTSSASGGSKASSTTASGGASTTSSSSAEPTGGRATGGTSTASSTSTANTGGRSAAGGTGGNQSSTGGRTATGGSNSSQTTSAGRSSSGGSSSSSSAPVAGATSNPGSGKSAGCGKTPGISSDQYNKGAPISITAAGMQRRFVLNVPTNYDNNNPYRLVVVYHQRDGNDKQMFNWNYYGLLPLSNNTTIFVAPNGQKNGAPCSGTGDGDSNCGWPNSSDSDLALADAVVAKIQENFCIDTNRIFATGWSYGGSMSFRTACSRPLGGTSSWGVRGIAIYAAAQLSGNCTPSKPVAYYHAHGTRDSVLNYDNMGLPLAQAFAKANSCTWATPPKVTSGAHQCVNMAGCATGYPLEFCSFNGDHTPFPDNGQAQGSWGPAEAWKFLSQF